MPSNEEIEFLKYKMKGAYHWDQISVNPMKRNPFVLARYENVIALLKRSCDLKQSKVLDVGCGDGVLTYLLRKEGVQASGLDYSHEAIAFAQEKTKGLDIDYQQGSAYELPYDDNTFDAVVSSDVIEHLQDVNAYLDEIKRVVKPGGIIVLSTPIRYTEKPLDSMHVVEWFEGEYKEVIEKKLSQTEYFSSHPIFWFEFIQRRFRNQFLLNLLSLVGFNPFRGFESKFTYKCLQYSVSKNV